MQARLICLVALVIAAERSPSKDVIREMAAGSRSVRNNGSTPPVEQARLRQLQGWPCIRRQPGKRRTLCGSMPMAGVPIDCVPIDGRQISRGRIGCGCVGGFTRASLLAACGACRAGAGLISREIDAGAAGNNLQAIKKP